MSDENISPEGRIICDPKLPPKLPSTRLRKPAKIFEYTETTSFTAPRRSKPAKKNESHSDENETAYQAVIGRHVRIVPERLIVDAPPSESSDHNCSNDDVDKSTSEDDGYHQKSYSSPKTANSEVKIIYPIAEEKRKNKRKLKKRKKLVPPNESRPRRTRKQTQPFGSQLHYIENEYGNRRISDGSSGAYSSKVYNTRSLDQNVNGRVKTIVEWARYHTSGESEDSDDGAEESVNVVSNDVPRSKESKTKKIIFDLTHHDLDTDRVTELSLRGVDVMLSPVTQSDIDFWAEN